MRKMERNCNKTMKFESEFINERHKEGKKENIWCRRKLWWPALCVCVVFFWRPSEMLRINFRCLASAKDLTLVARQKRAPQPRRCDMLVNNKSVRKLRGSVLSVHAARILEFASKEPYWDYPRYIPATVIKGKKRRDASPPTPPPPQHHHHHPTSPFFSSCRGDSVSSVSMVRALNCPGLLPSSSRGMISDLI